MGVLPGRGRRTIETTPLPLSFTVRGNGASRPVWVSFSSRKAWCARFGLPLSLAVRMILAVSALPRVTTFDRGFEELSLVSLVSNWCWSRRPVHAPGWVTHFSFIPSGPFLEVTAMVASSKLQDEAAWAVPAARSSIEETSDPDSLILQCSGGNIGIGRRIGQCGSSSPKNTYFACWSFHALRCTRSRSLRGGPWWPVRQTRARHHMDSHVITLRFPLCALTT